MSQTLPRIDEGTDYLQSTAPSGGGSASENVLNWGVQSNHFFGTAPLTGMTTDAPSAVFELVIPVYNEEGALEASVRRLRAYLDRSFPFETTIVIVDNASTDGTWQI